jgi:hypothetical protein
MTTNERGSSEGNMSNVPLKFAPPQGGPQLGDEELNSILQQRNTICER